MGDTPGTGSPNAPHWRSSVSLAAAALLTGYALYAVARPHTHWFLLWHVTPLFDPNASSISWLIGSAPSFLHTLAFALLLALAVGGDRRRRCAACLAWGAIEIIAELAQLPPGGLLAGTFSVVDIVAVVLGTASAIAIGIRQRGNSHEGKIAFASVTRGERGRSGTL
jgi:hypothetical protein